MSAGSPLRIAFVSLAGLPFHVAAVPGARGGAERQTSIVAQLLNARGHDVSMIVCDYDDAARKGRRLTDLRLINAYNRGEGLPGVRFFTPRWTGLNRAIDEARPDVVFQMCAAAATGLLSLYCRRRGIGFVFATASDTDVQPDRLRLGPKERWLYRYGLRRADRVVTQHGRQAREMLANYGVDSVPLPLGADFPAEEPPPPKQPPVVTWLGTIRSVKRPDRFFTLARRFPYTKFVMAGGRTAAQPEAYDQAEAEAKALPNVEFVGFVEDPGTVLAGSWALLNTSDVEGFPSTFLEAWGRGLPVVSLFDPDGLTATEDLGWIAEDDEDLARCLGVCLENKALRDAKGARGRAYVLRDHAPDVVAGKVETVLREAIAAANR